MDRCSRRTFLKIGGAGLATWLVPTMGWAALHPDRARRTLSFFNTHTNEHLSVCYFKGGAYSSRAMKKINHILRDHRTGSVRAIDPRLMDLLFDVNQQLGCGSPFHIICGYRSPKTNARLRRKSSGVARHSYHIQGRAIDIRLPDCDTSRLHKACIKLQAGGVGYYPRSDFVHVDTGAFRTWQG